MNVKAFRVTLPWPPTVNHYWGRRVIPVDRKKTKFRIHTFIARAGQEFRAQVLKDLKARYPLLVPLSCRLCVKVELCPPTKAQRDLDNFNKGPLDALKHAGVYVDDSQIDDLRVVRGPVVSSGCVKVTLWKHEKQPQTTKELFK